MHKKIVITIFSILIKCFRNIKSFVGLYCIFLSENLRIKLINNEKFSNFTNNFLITFRLGNSINDFANKLLIKSFYPILDLEYLTKFMFLISPLIYKKNY